MNKRKILIGCIFVIAGLMVGVTFVTAATYLQLAIAIFLYPLLALFFFVAFPRMARVVRVGEMVTSVRPQIGLAGKIGTVKEEKAGIIDIDKRSFLKLIGGAGLAFFLFSVFRNRIEGLFFKNLPVQQAPAGVPANNTVNPSLKEPMDGYSITEIDDGNTSFYGFTNKDGAWFIMREDTDSSFRYAKGNSDFSDNWGSRKNLKYDYFYKLF